MSLFKAHFHSINGVTCGGFCSTVQWSGIGTVRYGKEPERDSQKTNGTETKGMELERY